MFKQLGLVVVLLSPTWVFAQAVLENPAPNSNQSGIGIVSGWKCTAGTITVRFNGGLTLQAAYGTDRADTQAVCGDSNNGFGLLFNWNLLGPGMHLVEVLDTGTVFTSANVNVATFGEEFLSGQSGTLTGTFAGREVTAQWSESAQNFVITSTGNPPVTGETGKWQATREESAFSDLPTVTLSLPAETPVNDFLGTPQTPFLFVQCAARSSLSPESGNFVVIGVDHNQGLSASATFIKLDEGEPERFLAEETGNNEVLRFSNFSSVELLDAFLSSQTMAYLFSALNRGDVETTFDLRGLEAIMAQQFTISLRTEGVTFPTYDCTPL